MWFKRIYVSGKSSLPSIRVLVPVIKTVHNRIYCHGANLSLLERMFSSTNDSNRMKVPELKRATKQFNFLPSVNSNSMSAIKIGNRYPPFSQLDASAGIYTFTEKLNVR